MTSGPRELAAYHAAQLEKENHAMPKHTQQDELNTDNQGPVEDIEALARGKAWLAAMNADTGLPAPAKPRKTRTDAGKPRTAKPKAPERAPAVVSGGLTKDEASEIYTLSVKINVAIDNERLALSAYQDAVIETTHAKDALKERLKALTNDVLKA